MYMQDCGDSEPTAGHFGLFSSLLSCSPYTLYTAQLQFTRHSLDLSDNVLYDWYMYDVIFFSDKLDVERVMKYLSCHTSLNDCRMLAPVTDRVMSI